MKTLSIDIETFSETDIKKSGVYCYASDPAFEILLFAFAIDDQPVQLVDLASGEDLPMDILYALTAFEVLKTAHNANFERTCISQHFNLSLPVEQWECTMARTSMLGLPLSLDAASKALKLDATKSAAGKALIKYFTMPCKPTKANGGRTRNLPEHDPEKWQQFRDYCIQDVVVERSIRTKLSFFTPTETERILWHIDQTINDTGVLLDPQFVRNAIRMDLTYREKLTEEAIELTGLDNPNSAAQLKTWLTEHTGEQVSSLTKAAVPELLKLVSAPNVKRVLNIRQEMAKTSVKKYNAMAAAICPDNRVRGLLQYYGANRTGRWAGRLVQVQNLPKNELLDLDLARQLVREGDLDTLDMLFGNVPDTLSQLIRTSFVAPDGHRFIVADFSAIEARVIAWLAGERWRLDVFNTHGKIYEASAAQMFKVPLESISYKDAEGKTQKGPNYHLRQKGKVSELALGYQGGPNAIRSMEISNRTPVEKMIPEEELPKLVAMWRQANKKIVQLWYDVEAAAVKALQGEPNTIKHDIKFYFNRNILNIQLPSGRTLCYLRPKLVPSKFGGESIIYEGMNQTTKQWGRQDTYGGKLVENIVQAIARDCLADAMIRVSAAGYKVVMHVHDELVLEVKDGEGSLEEVNSIMSAVIPWANGLPLTAESYETKYYKKD